MSETLILVTLGPVQDFIASARRTRDLWFGSHLLSELARAAALALARHGATLIMPALAPGQTAEVALAPQDGLTERNPRIIPNVANKLLVTLPATADPELAVKDARSAALNRLNAFSDQVKERYHELIAHGAQEAWQEQLDTVLEFLAAWTKLDDHASYSAARDALEGQLAGRKNLRQFQQWRRAQDGVPKSSLDGARSSVIEVDKNNKAAAHAKQLRLSEGEQLDAIGLIKRAGGKPKQFIPLITITNAAWVQHAQAQEPQRFERLVKAAEQHSELDSVYRELDWVKRFTFEGHLFSVARHQIIAKEEKLQADDPVFKLANDLIHHVRREPFPYVACLVADGDRMGKAIDLLTTPQAHQTFSAALAEFAREARQIVEHEHRGGLVYAGGDDVLAFVCLPDAVSCAKRLSEAFTAAMTQALPKGSTLPTLSVGLGVGHVLESMGYLLDLGRKAEKQAKASHLKDEALQRNALALVLDKRSGGLISWRSQWTDDPAHQIAQALGGYTSRQLSSKKVYQLRDMLRTMPKPQSDDAKQGRWRTMLRMEIGRALSRNLVGIEGAVSAVSPQALGLDLSSEDYATLYARVEQWTTLNLIARTLLEADPSQNQEQT